MLQVKKVVQVVVRQGHVDKGDRSAAGTTACRRPDCTVVIPAFNGQRYISESVRSAIASDQIDVEVIIVDDGSTDNTLMISFELARQNPSITIVHQSNGGVSGARNAGLAVASADLICFLDADDSLEANGLKILFEALRADSKAVGAVGRISYMDSESLEAPIKQAVSVGGRNLELRDVLQRNFTDTPGSVLFRTTEVRAAGGFNPLLKHGEDWEFYVRMAERGPFVRTDQLVMRYRLHQASVMHNVETLDFEPALKAVFNRPAEAFSCTDRNLRRFEHRKRARLLRARRQHCAWRGLKIDTARQFWSLIVGSGFDLQILKLAAIEILSTLKNFLLFRR